MSGTLFAQTLPEEDTIMSDTTVTKVNSAHSPAGAMGQKYLASGVRVAMRLWDESPHGEKEMTAREYETVGYVIRGRAELELEVCWFSGNGKNDVAR